MLLNTPYVCIESKPDKIICPPGFVKLENSLSNFFNGFCKILADI